MVYLQYSSFSIFDSSLKLPYFWLSLGCMSVCCWVNCIFYNSFICDGMSCISYNYFGLRCCLKEIFQVFRQIFIYLVVSKFGWKESTAYSDITDNIIGTGRSLIWSSIDQKEVIHIIGPAKQGALRNSSINWIFLWWLSIQNHSKPSITRKEEIRPNTDLKFHQDLKVMK